MVAVHSRCTVVPSKPTPNGRMWLSESDQQMAWTHALTLYVYKPENPKDAVFAFETLKTSLSEALVLYYPLAGRLHWLEGSRLELDCCAKGAELSEAISESGIEELGDFKPDDSIRPFIPKVLYSTPMEELPVLMAQLTRFSCGAVTIGIAISHMLVDGISAINFVNTWARLARGDSPDDCVMPVHDRTILKLTGEVPEKTSIWDLEEYKKPPLLIGRSDAAVERKSESQVLLLKLTKDQVEKLRKKANQDKKDDDDYGVIRRPYSRYEAMAGHMWQCACEARSNESSQLTRVRIGVDLRSRLKQPPPQAYFGNTVLPAVTLAYECGDITSNPLSSAAEKIREATQRMTNEYIKTTLQLLATVDDVARVRAAYHTLGCSEVPFWGNPNLAIGSWTTLPVYDSDFGWGKPVYMGPGSLNNDGKSFIMASPHGDGSVIIALRLQTKHVDAFKKLFYEDL